ncbi:MULTISPECIES: hypothetical protein [Clostridium]|nr:MULTISPECIES: hypothetical protein [Clostridium]ENZ31887.1 hypothetical protein HMPREF1084_02830 [Clostridium butyricum 60E.3]MDB2140092.1 hypothetical protein [Clostridium butyricum]MDU1232665.1 hypothetical protein [Clostridium sp.]MDU1340653.1 hypothetical protein [Clostridium butyricum]MDU3091781.1 hypothetical protein [Clostridium sp.]
MGIIKRMALEKKESLEIAKRTEKLFLNGKFTYESALRRVKEEFEKAIKDTDQSSPR